MTNERIKTLDGLRAVAIILVMLYHFMAHSEGRYYDYAFKVPEVMHYFYLGVQLFFIISGFAITLTLNRSKGFFEFMKKRYIRLAPAMLLCSVITWLFFITFDKIPLFSAAHYFPNLVISNTFIRPWFFDYFFGISTVYLDGSYWTLWVEVQFYIVAGLLFFLSPKRFLFSFSLLAGFMFLFLVMAESPYVLGLSDKPAWKSRLAGFQQVVENFALIRHVLWFLAGVIIYKMYHEGKTVGRLVFLLAVFLVQIAWDQDLYAAGFTILTLITFLLFLYRPSTIAFLSGRLIVKIGIASYAIYLIHESMGMFLINRLSPYLGSWNWILPPMLVVVFCLFGFACTKYWERPVQRTLRNWLMNKPARQPINHAP